MTSPLSRPSFNAGAFRSVSEAVAARVLPPPPPAFPGASSSGASFSAVEDDSRAVFAAAAAVSPVCSEGPPPLLAYCPPKDCLCCAAASSAHAAAAAAAQATPTEGHSASFRVSKDPSAGSALAAAVGSTDTTTGGAEAVFDFEWSEPCVEQLLQQLRRRELLGSHRAAKKTADALRRVVEACPPCSTAQLLEAVRRVGFRLMHAAPLDLLVGNVVRRVLCILRQEHYKHQDASRHRDASLRELSLKLQGHRGGLSSNALSAAAAADGAVCASSGRRGACASSSSSSSSLQNSQTQPGADAAASGGGGCLARGNKALLQQKQRFYSQRATPTLASYFDPHAAADAQDLLRPMPSTVKHAVFESLSELVAEIDSLWEDGEEVRLGCFLEGDCILVFGYSLAVQRLLTSLHERNVKLQTAAGRRGGGGVGWGAASSCSSAASVSSSSISSFEVIVLGGDPEDGGRRMALSLKQVGIRTTFVPDAALFPVMARVDKVLLGTVAVLASGAVVTVGGASVVAHAAKLFSKPLLVAAPLFKISNMPFFDHYTCNELLPPSAMVPDGLELGDVSIRIPMFDFIPRSLVSIFITDVGPVDPSYLFSLAKQRYHSEDLALGVLN